MELRVNTQSFWIHSKVSFEETEPEIPLYWYVHSKDRISQMPLVLWIQQHEGQSQIFCLLTASIMMNITMHW